MKRGLLNTNIFSFVDFCGVDAIGSITVAEGRTRNGACAILVFIDLKILYLGAVFGPSKLYPLRLEALIRDQIFGCINRTVPTAKPPHSGIGLGHHPVTHRIHMFFYCRVGKSRGRTRTLWVTENFYVKLDERLFLNNWILHTRAFITLKVSN